MQYMPCDRFWALMSNDMRYGCTSSDNVLALSTLGWMCALWAARHSQQFASLLNAVKVRLRAECQCCCLDIESNGVRVHVKCSMHCAPLWFHPLSYLYTDTPKFFSFQKSTNPNNNVFQQVFFHHSLCLWHPSLQWVKLPGLVWENDGCLYDGQSL